MERRVQTVNGDTVLEITHTEPVKVRYSEKRLIERKERLEKTIARAQEEIAEVDGLLTEISNGKGKQR